jgi:hypothetical protein
MADDFETCAPTDEPEYECIATQFFEAMTKYQTTDPKGYWMGRLLAFGFTVENFLGLDFDEETFREDLENADIILHGYTLNDVNYAPESERPLRRAVVTGKVELDVTINGKRQTVTRDFRHLLKQSWVCTQAGFS